MGPQLPRITLNVSWLNAPTKRQILAEQIQKRDPYICCLQETHLKTRDTFRLKVKDWKKNISCKKRPKQDKPKVKHPKTHTNQINKDQTQRTNIKSSKGETTNNTQRDSHKDKGDLSIETFQARREWQDILRVMKENNLQPRLLYPARISFRYEGELKSFTDKQKLREFSTTKSSLQQMLKDLLQTGKTERLYKCEPKTTK